MVQYFYKMGVKYFKNSICSLVIVSIIMLPYLSIPKKVEAVEGISGYVKSLSPVISQLFQCKGKTQKAFGGPSSMGNGDDKPKNLSTETDIAGAQANSVSVVDTTAHDKLDLLLEDTGKVKKDVEETNTNETCLKSIGKLVIKMLLQKVTQSTVAWINSGFEGSPAFIQDAPAFWKDVAREEILGFSAEINNPVNFPFGQAFIQSQVDAFNNHFADNARYSLNELMDNSDTTINGPFSANIFMEDFSHGGWDAWNYMTQVPANNPLGFNVLASTELSARLEGTGVNRATEIRSSLQEAGGFLGQERCADPEGVTRTQHKAGLAERASSAYGPYQNQICNKWEYVTPGQMVAESATKLVHYPDNQYLKADDLNDAIGAILDALLAQWSSDLQDGFAEFSTQGSEGDLVINFDNYDAYGDGTVSSQTANDYPADQLGTSWFVANPNFNIRTDLTQALIDEQRIYIQKLEEQNKELLSTTDGKNYTIPVAKGVSNAYGLIPIIYQLDYCVPGPHPGWEIDSRETLEVAKGEIQDVSGMTDEGMEALQTALGFLDPGGIIGMIVGWATAGDLPLAKRNYYKASFEALTGIRGVRVGEQYSGDSNSENIGYFESPEQVKSVLDIIFDKYQQAIENVFDLPKLPDATAEANAEFNKLPAYKQIVKNNKDKIPLMKSAVLRLEQIRAAVNELNQNQPADYEEQLQPWLTSFGRLTENMVTGNQIAKEDTILKQIKDKKKYLYDSLLKGPTGCERELQNVWPRKLPAQITTAKRMSYPRENPILYDYNNFAQANLLPDPFNSGFDTRIGDHAQWWAPVNSGNPGFLAFLTFGGFHPENAPIKSTTFVKATFGDPGSEDLCWSNTYPNMYIDPNSGNPNQDTGFKTILQGDPPDQWTTPQCGIDLAPVDPLNPDDWQGYRLWLGSGGGGVVGNTDGGEYSGRFESVINVW